MLKNYLETLLAFEENKQEVAISISDQRIFLLDTKGRSFTWILRSVQQNRVIRRIYLKTVYPDKVHRSI